MLDVRLCFRDQHEKMRTIEAISRSIIAFK